MKTAVKIVTNETANSGQTILTSVNLEAYGHFPFRWHICFRNTYCRESNDHHLENVYFTFAFMEINHKCTHSYLLIKKTQKHFHSPITHMYRLKTVINRNTQGMSVLLQM